MGLWDKDRGFSAGQASPTFYGKVTFLPKGELSLCCSGFSCPSSWSFFLFLQVAQAVNLRGPGALIMPRFFAEEGLLYRARYFGDTDMYHRAQKMGTPSCSRLSEVQASLHG